MVFMLTAEEAQRKIADNCCRRRLAMGLTQADLSARSGVSLPSLRRFEQKSAISLEGFLKLQAILGGLNDVLAASDQDETVFSSIDEILGRADRPKRKRGRRK